MNYWKEAVMTALEDEGVSATDEQIEGIAETIAGAHENYGMAHGHDAIPNPLLLENERLQDELKRERRKTICEDCKGKGYVTTPGPYHSAISDCQECRGAGVTA